MKNILVFGASNSRNSINQQFAHWVGTQINGVKMELLDLNDFEMPIYGIDRENESGIPEKANAFKEKLRNSDGVIISFAEHNGSYATAFKNILDWISRLGRPIWENKPMLILATSPGGRGAQLVLKTAMTSLPHQGADITGSFSLPNFGQNFNNEAGVTDSLLLENLKNEIAKFESKVHVSLDSRKKTALNIFT